MRKATKGYVSFRIIKQTIPQEDGTSSKDGLGDQPKDGGREGQRMMELGMQTNYVDGNEEDDVFGNHDLPTTGGQHSTLKMVGDQSKLEGR